MAFERIDMEQWPRREHYRYYSEQICTSYEMNVELDVTKLRKRCRKKGIHFYPAMMYAIRLIRFFTKMMRHFRISGQSGMRILLYFTKMSAGI